MSLPEGHEGMNWKLGYALFLTRKVPLDFFELVFGIEKLKISQYLEFVYFPRLN